MSRIIKCGLIQAHNVGDVNAPINKGKFDPTIPTIK